jgi:hypothetical protein
MRARITTVLDQATPLVDGGGKDADVAARLNALADEVRVSGDDQTAKRMSGLKATLSGIAQRVG